MKDVEYIDLKTCKSYENEQDVPSYYDIGYKCNTVGGFIRMWEEALAYCDDDHIWEILSYKEDKHWKYPYNKQGRDSLEIKWNAIKGKWESTDTGQCDYTFHYPWWLDIDTLPAPDTPVENVPDLFSGIDDEEVRKWAVESGLIQFKDVTVKKEEGE